MELYIATLHHYEDMSEVIGVFGDEQLALTACGLVEASYPGNSSELDWQGYQEVMNDHYGLYGIGGGYRNYFIEKLTLDECHTNFNIGKVTL